MRLCGNLSLVRWTRPRHIGDGPVAATDRSELSCACRLPMDRPHRGPRDHRLHNRCGDDHDYHTSTDLLFQENLDPARRTELLGVALRTGRQMNRLIGDLLDTVR